jgi:putative tRNA adenosine deaminase-associated protein
MQPTAAGSSHVGERARTCWPARSAPIFLPRIHASARSASLMFLDLTTFPRAGHAWGMAMPEVSETDFAIVVFREDDQWEADVLPEAVTADLAGLVRVLRQQPSIAGTIGLAGIDDYFFVAIRVVGSQVSVLLSDIGAALDYPLAKQVLEYLDIPVPDEEDLDQVLPAGDLSIFADLGLDEMELAAICSRLDLDSDDDPWDHVEDAVESIAARLGFGLVMERALDVALGS